MPCSLPGTRDGNGNWRLVCKVAVPIPVSFDWLIPVNAARGILWLMNDNGVNCVTEGDFIHWFLEQFAKPVAHHIQLKNQKSLFFCKNEFCKKK
jgi:hypothetical protein